MLWGTPTHSSMYYVYSYDGNNRMTNANFNRSGMSPTALDVHYTYDLNGNIKTLDRYGFQGTYIDRLTFTYSGNQVIGLSDASGDVAQVTDYPGSSSPMALNYDDNGNVDVETHKLIETTYNLLNLPFELNWLGQNRRINYYYTFEGEKLRKRVENNRILTKEDYCGPFVYETASGVRSLKYIVTPKGRAVRNGSNWSYEYHLADHLGNVRAVIRKGANGMAELIQQRHYYPFGMEISNMSSGTGTNKYLYNGKEIQNDFDLYWYDYGARFFDPQIGRWHSVDPMASERSWVSPYSYCQNNPMNRIDPTGALDILDNYTIFSDGTIYKEETNDPTNTYTYIDQNGNSVDLGTYNVTSNSYGEDMVQAGTGANGSNSMYSWHDITSGNLYYEEDAFAGFLGGIQDFYNSSSQVPFRSPDKVQINQFMGLNRTHSNKGNRHSSLDVAFYRNDRTTGALASDNDVSDNLNLQLFNSLKSFGLGSKSVFTATSVNSHTPYIPGTTGLPNHHHHFHFEGFNNNVIPTLPTVTIRAYHPIIYSLTNMIR